MHVGIIGTTAIAASMLLISVRGVQAQNPRGSHSPQTARAGAERARAGDVRFPFAPQPRFKIEASGVTAIDESGPDWLGSDEVYAITRAGASACKQKHWTMSTLENRTRSLPIAIASRPIQIQYTDINNYPCDAEGMSGPLSFNVRLYEQDFNWGELVGDFRPILIGDPQPGPDDDLIGRQDVTLRKRSCSRGCRTLATLIRSG